MANNEGGWRTRGGLPSGIPSPEISVVTVVYNGEKFLNHAMTSVLSQEGISIEYIVIDGGSKDRSLDIIRQHEDRLAYWKSEPDRGIYNAMNKGIALATAPVVALLNADDFYLPGTLKRVLKSFHESHAGIVYGNVLHVQEMETMTLIKPGKPNLERMKETMTLIHPAVFIKKEVYDTWGVYDESIRVSADYELLLRAIVNGVDFQYLDGPPLTGYRAGGLSTANCGSILEARDTKRKHLGGNHNNMTRRYWRCVWRHRIRKLVYFWARVTGQEKRLKERLVRKWNA